MKWIKSMIIAFSMYSKLPMPHMEWDKEGMKYAICFFPAVGFIEGAIFFLLWTAGTFFHFPKMCLAAMLTVFPVLLTGGIHMDGFLDTMDARSSFQTRERRLAILSDSHTGAFAIIGCCVYMILYFGGIFSLEHPQQVLLAALGFMISRILSGLAIVYWKSAKNEGLMYTFASAAQKKGTRICLLVQLLICVLAMLAIQPVWGITALCAAGAVFIYYRAFSYSEFGGITGDLAGFFLQLCELAILYGLIIIYWVVS